MFERACPFYLSIGMTYEQFWYGDTSLTKPYREAARLRNERADTIAWLIGQYTYVAIADMSPSFNPFSKSKCRPYLDKPLSSVQKDQHKEAVKQRKADKAREFMEVFAVNHNLSVETEADE